MSYIGILWIWHSCKGICFCIKGVLHDSEECVTLDIGVADREHTLKLLGGLNRLKQLHEGFVLPLEWVGALLLVQISS